MRWRGYEDPTYDLFAVAENVLEFGVRFQHPLVEEGGDGDTVLGQNWDGRRDQLALLSCQRRRVRKIGVGFDDTAHSGTEGRRRL